MDGMDSMDVHLVHSVPVVHSVQAPFRTKYLLLYKKARLALAG